jgi:hypothetical protein
VRGSVQGRCDYTTTLDIQVDPSRRGFSRHESNFALQPKWGTLGRAQDRASAASRNHVLG